MPTFSEVRHEVERLHAFFVEWYAGTVGRGQFARFEDALAPGFQRVTPEGERLDRRAVLDGVREAYRRDDPSEFDIEIRNVEVVADCGECVAVRYEEFQLTPGEEAGRVSIALLREDPDAPGGLAWLDVQETRL